MAFYEMYAYAFVEDIKALMDDLNYDLDHYADKEKVYEDYKKDYYHASERLDVLLPVVAPMDDDCYLVSMMEEALEKMEEILDRINEDEEDE